MHWINVWASAGNISSTQWFLLVFSALMVLMCLDSSSISSSVSNLKQFLARPPKMCFMFQHHKSCFLNSSKTIVGNQNIARKMPKSYPGLFTRLYLLYFCPYLWVTRVPIWLWLLMWLQLWWRLHLDRSRNQGAEAESLDFETTSLSGRFMFMSKP